MMAPRPTRDTPAGRAYNDLRNLAHRIGRPTDELIATYVHEGFLARLATSAYRDRFVLKGGMLLAALDARRATRDIDALARGMAGAVDEVLTCVQQVATTVADDGLVFRAGEARSRQIREDATCPGTRVTMPVDLARARSKFAIDISVGDPVVPGPRLVELPLLLGGAVELLGYPLEGVLAEKIVTAVSLGELSTRVRDYADVWRLTQTHDVDGAPLVKAALATATYRRVPLQRLSDAIGRLSDLGQVAYRQWCDRQPAQLHTYPKQFDRVITEVAAFADPVLDGSASGLVWHAATGVWARRTHRRLPWAEGPVDATKAGARALAALRDEERY
jgi:predicted nucleotidyltransferase component of viral defense system